MEQIEISPEVLVSGKASFKIEVPYKLFETGEKRGKKPLIVYLHGYNENLKTFQEKCSELLLVDAYHLFIQGPYPIPDKKGEKTVSNWGRAWYLYDGKRKQFIKSLELTSEFIQEVIDNLIKFIDVSRLCMIGYSMGGYQAGYFALTRWKHVNDLIVIGARIKTEILQEGDWENLRHMNIIALHGKNDTWVKPEPQQKEIERLQSNGIHAEINFTDDDHKLTENTLNQIRTWLTKLNYLTEPN